MNAHQEIEVKTTGCDSFHAEKGLKGHRRSRVSLKQWTILHAVIDHGGFAHAAEYLHLSQSAISYTIGQMQKQLGVPILKIEGRKAQVTPEGLSILKRSRVLVKEAIELEEYAMKCQHDQTTEVKLAVDEYCPTPLVMQAIRAYSSINKMVNVKLLETSRTAVEAALHDRTVDVAINSRVPLGFVGDPIMKIEYVPVAHPEHHLFKLGREITNVDILEELEVAIGAPQSTDSPWREDTVSQLRWEVSNFDTAVSALCECLGYGWLPRHRIQRSLDRGKLKMLPLCDRQRHSASLFLIYARPSIMTPEALRLADTLRRVAAEEYNFIQ